MSLNKAKQTFAFKTQLSLVLLTGLRAKNILQLRNHLKAVPASSVYYHTHHFLQEHDFLVPEPSNDFTYWVTHILQEEKVGEKLKGIDTVRFHSLNDLREAFLTVLDSFLKKKPKLREAPPGQEFNFMKSILFSLPTSYVADDLGEFVECLKRVSVHSLYYHIFEARLRKPGGINDFSEWLESSLDEKELAKKIEKLNPYFYTMEDLRAKIIYLAQEKLKGEVYAAAR